MRMERPEAEILHRKKEGKREKKNKVDRKARARARARERRENGALTDRKQTAQRKRYHPPLDSFDATG